MDLNELEEEIVIFVNDEDPDHPWDYPEYEYITDNKNILIEANPNIILKPVSQPTIIPKIKAERKRTHRSIKALLSKGNTKTTRKSTSTNNQRSSRKELALCTICGKQVRMRYISRHTSNHSIQKCDICPSFFDNEEELLKHQNVEHLDNVYPCQKCELSFKTARDNAIHSRQHFDSFQCPLCTFSTKSKSSIIGHIKRHEGRYQYVCGICGKGFIGKALLAAHEEIHLDIKKYTCELCGKKFSVGRYLKVHQQLNHKKELFGIDELFMCSICGRQFTFEKSLRRHESVIHQIGEDRTVQCKICDKTIANNYNLKMHMRIHTGEKSYCCDICGKAFSAYKYWKKHKLTHEKNKMGTIGAVTMGEHCNKRYNELEIVKVETDDTKNFESDEFVEMD